MLLKSRTFFRTSHCHCLRTFFLLNQRIQKYYFIVLGSFLQTISFSSWKTIRINVQKNLQRVCFVSIHYDAIEVPFFFTQTKYLRTRMHLMSCCSNRIFIVFLFPWKDFEPNISSKSLEVCLWVHYSTLFHTQKFLQKMNQIKMGSDFFLKTINHEKVWLYLYLLPELACEAIYISYMCNTGRMHFSLI